MNIPFVAHNQEEALDILANAQRVKFQQRIYVLVGEVLHIHSPKFSTSLVGTANLRKSFVQALKLH